MRECYKTVSATQQILRFGVFELNPATEELRKSGVAKKLPPQPFRLLVLLASRTGEVVTREELQKAFWDETESDVDFERRLSQCVKQVRSALSDNASRPVYIETVHRQGYRFLAPVESRTITVPTAGVIESPPSGTGRELAARLLKQISQYPSGERRWKGSRGVSSADGATPAVTDAASSSTTGRTLRTALMVGVVAVIALVAVVLYRRAHKPPALTEKDTIVVADFENKTGDPVFDDTLRLALSIQLEQSPFLNVLSNSRLNRALKMMQRSGGERLTAELAREVCLRTNSRAMVKGSIAGLGKEYVISMRAMDCNSGDTLAEAQEQAAYKAQVLKTMDTGAARLRRELGEGLTSVQKYGTPLSEATTSSLEALQAFSQGAKAWSTQGDIAAQASFKRAIELDPTFAIAYGSLAGTYVNLGEPGRAADNARKAYEACGKVSTHERLAIESFYYLFVTGELEKAAQVNKVWRQTYPRDDAPYLNLGWIACSLGDWERAAEAAREAMRLDPMDGSPYLNLGSFYQALNRLDDADATYKQAEKLNLLSENLLANRYQLAFLRSDSARMQELASRAMGIQGFEDLLLAYQADTAAWNGEWKASRELTLRAMDSAQRHDQREAAAIYQSEASLREVEAGNREQARAEAQGALKLTLNRDVRVMAALALALAGDIARAEKLAAELDQTFPADTFVQNYWLPSIRAAVALERKNPKQAIELLRLPGMMDLSQATSFNVYLCPVYLRGQAYLMLHDGNAAAAEFQKFINHYGLVGNFPWGSLARLGLARAYIQQSDKAKARAAYEQFLTLWKDADPDVPIYKQAKAEYARLQ